MEPLIKNLEELLSNARTGIAYNKNKEILKKFGLEVGDFILIKKTEDVPGIIYDEVERGKMYVVMGILNGNLHVKGLNNKHWGYLHFEYVLGYEKIEYHQLSQHIYKV